MDNKTLDTITNLTTSIETELRAQIRRKKFEQTFISGVHSTPLLSVNSKFRKHYEFCLEAMEQIEKLFFHSNNQNFLFAGPDYGQFMSLLEK